MQQDMPVLDLQFGISQLSGNRDLFIKLLGKFKAEYLVVTEKLSELIRNDDVTAVKNIVHTIKGVSGNLGLRALHHVCKELEQSLLADDDSSTFFAEFCQTILRTFQEIDMLSSEAVKQQERQSDKTDAKKQLIASLQSNEYIPAEKLSSLLEELDLDESDKQEIESAINDLDYPDALSRLGV